MSWAEEQDWFGTEDIFLEVLRDTEEDKFFLKRGIWVDKNGHKHPISKMKTSYIINCIRLIQRSNGWRKQYLNVLLKELKSRSHD